MESAMSASSRTPMHLSQRVQQIEGSTTLEISALAAQLKAEGKPVIAFAAGEPDLPPPTAVQEAAKDAIDKNLGRYTPAAGLPALRAAAAERLTRIGLPHDANETIITSGAKSALYLSLWTLIEPGDEVIILCPYWSSYPVLIEAAGGVPVLVDSPAEDGFQPDPDRIRAAITPRTRAMMINSPNNPSGAVYTKASMESLAEIVRETDIHVITDDIYDELVYGDDAFVHLLHAAPDLRERVIAINGLSKSHSMTGWRIGYIGAPAQTIAAMGRLQGQIVGNACSISQHAGIAALTTPVDPTRAETMDRRRRFLLERLQGIEGLETPEPHGAFYAFPSVKPWLGRRHRGVELKDSADLAKALLEHHLVATVPGTAFGAPDHLRITYCLARDVLGQGVDRIQSFLDEIE